MALLVRTVSIAALPSLPCAENDVTCWFLPGGEAKNAEIKAIVDVLTQKFDMGVKPLMAGNYPQDFNALSSDNPSPDNADSFIQAIVQARGVRTPFAQVADGKKLYSGVMVYL